MLFLRITLTNIEIASIDKTSQCYFSMTILELKNKPLSVGKGLKNIVKLWKLRDISVITLKFVRIIGGGIRMRTLWAHPLPMWLTVDIRTTQFRRL
jgi:hypothetical protein